MKRRSASSGPNIDKNAWTTTYSDLMNNLLVLFILLYSMSVVDLEKFQQFTGHLAGNIPIEYLEGEGVTSPSRPDGSIEIPNTPLPNIDESLLIEPGVDDVVPNDDDDPFTNFDEFLHRIMNLLRAYGYEDVIMIEKVQDYIYFRFDDGVLFYPNLATLRPESYQMLTLVADIILEAYNDIHTIEIAGHTAYVPYDEDKNNFASWDLSANRALTVLKYLVQNADMPKNKMVIQGYSSTNPYIPNAQNDKDKALNRRVEIRISQYGPEGKPTEDN